jgi:signal transduction histidine kinase
MPLLGSNRDLLGVLSTFWREPRRPSEHELRIADLCARQAADVIAITRAEARTADLFEADRRKTEFLAMLAHELRNPLAPIRNSLEILRRTEGNWEAVRSASAMMERQISQMVRLVDDLLDVSRITRGKIELRKGSIELASVVNHAVEAAAGGEQRPRLYGDVAIAVGILECRPRPVGSGGGQSLEQRLQIH